MVIHLALALPPGSCGLPFHQPDELPPVPTFPSVERQEGTGAGCLALLRVEIAAFHPLSSYSELRDSSLWL